MQGESSEVEKYVCVLVFMLFMLLLESVGADGIAEGVTQRKV